MQANSVLRHIFLSLLFLSSTFPLCSQSIQGHFTQMTNEEIRLHGFEGLNTYTISSATTDENGHFQLNYSPSDYGMGYLVSSGDRPLFVILSEEDVVITGEGLTQP